MTFLSDVIFIHMKNYLIPKGCKNTGVRVSPHSFKNFQTFEFCLTSSALYTPEELGVPLASREFNSIQKVGGFSCDLFRTLDIRLGYNCKAPDGMFALYTYIDYHRKRWEWKPFCRVRADKTYTGSWKIDDKLNTYTLEIDGIAHITGDLPSGSSYGLGWQLFPYIEYGDMPSIKDVTIGWALT